ncbi:MAG: ThuA domain-containing protein [Kofleriaceae bacterium]
MRAWSPAILVTCLSAAVPGCGEPSEPEALSVVVVTRETLWFHPANPVAADAIRELGDARGWRVAVTGDVVSFTPDALASVDVVVFSLTSGTILDESSRAALEAFFQRGGGFAATHSAAATELDWPFYRTLMPATFKTHPVNPPVRAGVLTVEDPGNSIVAGLPARWARSDEFYTFYERPEQLGLDLLLALDETTLEGDVASDVRVGYHPLAWTHEHQGVRAFYTALGHTPESYAEPAFLDMLARGIEWAGGAR